MGSSSKSLGSLSAEKRKLFSLLLEKEGMASVSAEGIPRREASDPLSLSFAQQRLWFLDQLQPGSAVYNVPAALRLTGVLGLLALEQSLNEILRRHEALRTSFPATQGQPAPVIASHRFVALPVVNLGDLPEVERAAEALRLARAEAARPFDLAQGPLLRVVLLRLDEQDHVLVFNMHHIVSDGWSLGVFISELGALYAAFAQGQSSPLPDLPVQYADFAAWQRPWLQDGLLEQQLAYWRQQLAHPPTLDLPIDRPRLPAQTLRGATQCLTLPVALSRALNALSKRQGVTLFMTLLAAFQVLLHRYTGQDDIAVGSPVAGRNRQELEPLIGFFVNTLVLRADLSGEPTFIELLGRVRRVAVGAYTHQDLPFEKLVEALQPERDLSRNPLFQVMFALQNAPMPALSLPGVTWKSLEVDSGASKFDLTLSVTEEPEGLRAGMEYNTDLFEAATITRLLGHFEILLEGIAAHPEQRLSALPMLPEAELCQVLSEWNDNAADYPREATLHALFEAQAARRPEAVAVVFPSTGSGQAQDEQLSYGELNRRANQLAHHLQALGVGSEVLVGLCMQRSASLLVGLLGILKAGGAYLPLDPAYPEERLAFMLADARAPVLLTEQSLVGRLRAPETKVVCLDADWETISRKGEANPVTSITPENLTYVIYTSGSTGRPKGVQIPHRAVVNFLTAMAREPGLSEQDTLLAVTTLSFDIAALELFLPLITGARLVLLSREAAYDGAQLIDRLARSGATVMQATPATWRLLIESGWRGSPALKILCGGEALSRELADQLLAKGASLWNLYGPTETTIWSAACRVRSRPGSVFIGKPIANTQFYVLDRYLRPVPIGIPGELHIGGAGLARGYLERPELTAEKFIPNPFIPGERLYKTGDQVRYLTDGNIEFLGRIDQQVKLRGFRIELEEIETALGEHPAVAAAVVTAREDIPGDKRLVAYIVPCSESAPSASELRGFLLRKLPEYMVPSEFMVLESLPLMPNGKLDRQALPAPDGSRPDLEKAYVAPRTPFEEMLVEIWAEVLKRERIGVNDNFFELGGHSLLATQVISRVRLTLHTELPLRSLFEAPTVTGLAMAIDRIRGDKLASGKEGAFVTNETISRLPRDTAPYAFDVSFAQQRLWFLDQLEPGSSSYNIPRATLMNGALNVQALQRALEAIVARHESLRTRFENRQGSPVQIVTESVSVPVPVIDLREWPKVERETEAQRLAAEEARRPFDLACGPLLRVSLLRLDEQRHVLLLTLHHIISDGWSMGVLFRELAALYPSFCAGQPASLPALPVQYADFADWQRKWLQGTVLQHQLSYWKKQLEGAPAVLELPTDYPRPAVQSVRAASQSLALSRELTEAIKVLSRREGVSLFMTLLAAFKTLLYRHSGQQDIPVGTPIAGRNRGETEELIGFFISTLVLRTDLSGNPRFRELLARVREVALGAYAHQELPFERLVEELQPERSLSYTPLFQAFFNMLNLPDGRIELPGLTLERFASGRIGSKFDLTLYVTDRDQGIVFNLVYNADLFQAATIARWLGHFQVLLEGIVADPEQRLSSLPLLTNAERHALSACGNSIHPALPFREFTQEDIEQSIAQRFQQQVQRHRHRIAVQTRTHACTYEELNGAANRIAHALLARCGKGEERIALLFEHDAPMIAALLGVLKAGKSYVPLDPAYPQDRLGYMLDDAQAGAVLTNGKNLALAQALAQGKLPLIDSDALDSSAKTEEAALPVAPETLAYILYTSGSTGQPKGVMQSQRNVLHFIQAYTNELRISADDKLSLFSSYSFDAAVMDIFGALLNGACLCPVDLRDNGLTTLAEQLIEQEITVYHSTPTLYRYFTGTLNATKEAFPKLRLIVLGGEEVTKRDVDLYKEYFPAECLFVNLLGQSESSLNLLYFIDRQTALTRASVPVGYPVPDTEVLLLNEAGEETEVHGEIAIRSPYIALGYWQQPQLTQAVFLPDPQGGNRRIYRTGDRGRLLPDGSIEFLGRKDFQVKIRGYRIELREIEAVLAGHPALSECVVIVREDEPDERRLVAYVVPHHKQADLVSDLRNLLKQKLPEYMVPSTFVVLNELPLTPSRKIDRRALPVPDRIKPDGDFVAPRTPFEEMLVEIWAEVLKRERIGVNDNFFELGGHSLLATQVISRTREAFQIELPLRSLFETPSVAGMAVTIIELLIGESEQEQQEELASVGGLERSTREARS